MMEKPILTDREQERVKTRMKWVIYSLAGQLNIARQSAEREGVTLTQNQEFSLAFSLLLTFGDGIGVHRTYDHDDRIARAMWYECIDADKAWDIISEADSRLAKQKADAEAQALLEESTGGAE